MLILHQVTFSLYLIATIAYYIVYSMSDSETGFGNAVFITWGISVIMSAISQCVLIFIYWGLAAEVKVINDPTKSEEEDLDEENQVFEFHEQPIDDLNQNVARNYANS